MLAERAGVADEVAAVTEPAMRGELDFEESLRARVALLEGLPESALDEVYAELDLAPGARTLVRTLKRLGYRFGDRLAAASPSSPTGWPPTSASTTPAPTSSRSSTAGSPASSSAPSSTGPARRRRCSTSPQDSKVTVDQTVAIGDGANDLDMLAAAGLGIAFNAKPVVREAADTAVNVPYLDAILYLLGHQPRGHRGRRRRARHHDTAPRPCPRVS